MREELSLAAGSCPRRTLRSLVSAVLLLLTGAANAAFPTPGGEQALFHVYPASMLDVQKAMEEFLAEHRSQDYSLVADERTRSLVLVGPQAIHDALGAFLQERTAETMRRVVIEMQVMKTVEGQTEIVGSPRFELAEGAAKALHFDGAWTPGQGAPKWTSGLEIKPELDARGKIQLQLRGGPKDHFSAPVVLEVAPGEPVLIHPDAASHPSLEGLGKELNVGRDDATYSLRFTASSL